MMTFLDAFSLKINIKKYFSYFTNIKNGVLSKKTNGFCKRVYWVGLKHRKFN